MTLLIIDTLCHIRLLTLRYGHDITCHDIITLRHIDIITLRHYYIIITLLTLLCHFDDITPLRHIIAIDITDDIDITPFY
jgi:hypothetical protein